MDGLFSVYIIKGSSSKYIGITSDISERLRQHNEGFSRYTKGKGPWVLEWQSTDLSHTDALKLEKLMKKQKGGSGLLQLMKHHQRSS